MTTPVRDYPRGPRYSLDPIVALYPIRERGWTDVGNEDITPLHEVLNLSRQTIYRYLRDGMTTVQADRVAVALGLNAVDLWPSWYEDAAKEPACRVCGELVEENMVTCSEACRVEARRAGQRKVRSAA